MTGEQAPLGDRSHDEAFEQQVRAAVRRQVLLFREFSLTATTTRPAEITEEGLALFGVVTLEELGMVDLGLGKVPVKFFLDRDEAESHGFIAKLTGERGARWEARMDERAERLEEELEREVSDQTCAAEPEYVRADYLHHERTGATLLLYGIITGGGLHRCLVRFSADPDEVARWALAEPEDEGQ